MAPLTQDFRPRKVLLLLLISFVFTSQVLLVTSAHNTHSQEAVSKNKNQHQPFGRRGILKVQSEDDIADDDDQEQQQMQQKPIKKKPISTTPTSVSTKNKTKLIKPISTGVNTSSKNITKLVKSTSDSIKNQTKIVKSTSDSTKNQTKIPKPPSSTSSKNKTKLTKPTIDDPIEIKTKTPTIKLKPNSTSKPISLLAKKTSDTTKPTKTQAKPQDTNPDKKPKSQKKPVQHSWFDQEDEDDFVAKLAEFRDLPSKFQETLLPDLDIISSTSKVYINKANKEITNGFKPIVGKKYAPIIAPIVSFAFIIIPLILVSLVFNRIKAYFSFQKLIIFIQIYLSIYFSILSLSSIVTGLEPLKFFYATSQSTYVCIQLLQMLAYVLYLLLLLMYMVLVFSTDTSMVSKFLGLGQTIVGYAVGLHYYMTVFHRAVLHQPPMTSWKVHAAYATCFMVICLLARAERRKKAYSVDDGEEGKKS